MIKKTCILFTLILIANVQSFAQNNSLDKDMDKALEDLTQMLDTLSLEKLFDFDIAQKLDELKPDADQMETMQQMMKESVKMMQGMDFSAFEQIFKDLEGVMPELKNFDLPKATPPVQKKTEERKGKKKI